MTIVSHIWKMIRRRRILLKHAKVGAFWNNVMHQDQAGLLDRHKLVAKMDLPTNKIIWQYWGQGMENLPATVKYCFESVNIYKEDFTVIRITDNTIDQYLNLPDYIVAKSKQGIINRTFLSDILRLALLDVYGGVWLDATVLLTDKLPKQFLNQNFFVYQRDIAEENTDYWQNSYANYWGWDKGFKVRMLNSIIFAKCHHPLIGQMFHLLLNYWKTEDKVIDYFFFQILYEQLITSGYSDGSNILVSDVKPHLLQTKLSGGDYPISYDEVFKSSSLHKLTYYDDDHIVYLKKILRINPKRNNY